MTQNDRLEEHSRNIVSDLFGARTRTLQEVMRPRPDVTFVDGTLSIRGIR